MELQQAKTAFYDRAVSPHVFTKIVGCTCVVMALRLVMEYKEAMNGLQDNPVSGSA